MVWLTLGSRTAKEQNRNRICGYYLLHPIYAPSVSFGGFLISEYNKPDLIDT